MADALKDKRMNRLLALFAFLVFVGFLGVLVMGVPSPDLIVIVLLTAGLVAWDMITSSGKKPDNDA
jgi:hypothetical protein